MNELLQKHGCSVVFSAPEGLKELMSDITREVLREQPEKIFEFIANYLSVLILTREHGLLAVKLLDDLCDCRPTVSDHLIQLGLERDMAIILSDIIKEEVEEFEPAEGKEANSSIVVQTMDILISSVWPKRCHALKMQPEEPWQIAAERTLEIYKKTKPSFAELTRATQQIQMMMWVTEKVKEMQIMKRILARVSLDEDMAERVCQVSRNTFRDYWYRRKLMEQALKMQPEEPWQIAAERTLEIYKKTKPSFAELTRATQQIQAAYRGYYVRKNLLSHLKVTKPKKTGPKVDLSGPPVDIAHSRTIDLGPVIILNVREDDVSGFYDRHASKKLGLKYDPMKTLTHIEDKVVEERKPSIARPIELATRRVSIQVKKYFSDEEIASPSVKQPSRPSLGSSRANSRPSVGSRGSHSITTTPATSGHGISFAGLPPEVEIDANDDDPEIPEEIVAPLVEIVPEVPDEMPGQALFMILNNNKKTPLPIETKSADCAICMEDSRSDGDGRSTPSSAPLSTPRDELDDNEPLGEPDAPQAFPEDEAPTAHDESEDLATDTPAEGN